MLREQTYRVQHKIFASGTPANIKHQPELLHIHIHPFGYQDNAKKKYFDRIGWKSYDTPTNQQTNQETDMRVHRKFHCHKYKQYLTNKARKISIGGGRQIKSSLNLKKK